MECSSYDARKYFLCGMRLFFGIWLLYVGLTKWLAFGPGNFIPLLTNDFDKTWVPHGLTVALAWVILIAEPLLALFILSGKCPRSAWGLTSLFMFMLAIGQTILMKPDVIINWQFVVLTLACAALSDPGESFVKGAKNT